MLISSGLDAVNSGGIVYSSINCCAGQASAKQGKGNYTRFGVFSFLSEYVMLCGPI